MESQPAKVVGVDGCRGGWIGVWTSGEQSLSVKLYATVADLVAAHDDADRLLIDIPIGLPEREPRRCDQLARTQLGARGSSVFPVPCRAVVEYYQQARDSARYEEATDRNQQQLNRGLSKQAWHITPKIAAVDRLLRENPPATTVVESHPECCFAALNNGYPVAQPKSTAEGRACRFGILDEWVDGWQSCYEYAVADYYRKDVARDDIIDALVLAAAGQQSLRSLPEKPPEDAAGLPMQIVVPDTDPSWQSFLRLAEQ